MEDAPTIRVTHEPAGEIWQVHLRGEHDLATTDQIGDVLDRLPLDGRVVIDLTETSFIDSTVIGLLVARASAKRDAGGALVLVAPRAGMPRKVIDMVGLRSKLPVCGTPAEAVAELAELIQPDADPDPV